MTPIPPICLACEHFRDGMTCDAYPDGIPQEFYISATVHTEPRPDDNGFQFEPRNDLTDRQRQYVAEMISTTPTELSEPLDPNILY